MIDRIKIKLKKGGKSFGWLSGLPCLLSLDHLNFDGDISAELSVKFVLVCFSSSHSSDFHCFLKTKGDVTLTLNYVNARSRGENTFSLGLGVWLNSTGLRIELLLGLKNRLKEGSF